ncbi:hypothetical protein [Bordetella sp. BOR01]|uniref:hypothetical protein n=1 Tax=Bordetella sp. BOR01 TaxID=2854779 RepID=UPI001C456FB9|nr:hypothetical protein [Bordetella sp. BOR01]MBV7482495.1 hypothetical protein [Bordetella sp. BOR01]
MTKTKADAAQRQIEFFPIFCESIRSEVGGQFTYVGVFQSNVDVEQFPHTFSQFAVALAVVGPASVLRDQVATITVRAGTKLKAKIDVPPIRSSAPSDDDLIHMNLHVIGDTFRVDEPSSITATLSFKDWEACSKNVLNVRQKPSRKPAAPKDSKAQPE